MQMDGIDDCADSTRSKRKGVGGGGTNAEMLSVIEGSNKCIGLGGGG